jgi:phosphohistidine phosphatase SixA
MSTTKTPADAANFSRSPLGGKKSAVLSIRVTDEHKMDIERKAHEVGMSASEWAEKVLAVAAYGFDAVVESERLRTEKVCALFTTSTGESA